MIQTVNAYGVVSQHRFLLNENVSLPGTAIDIGRLGVTATIQSGLTVNQSGPFGKKAIRWGGTGTNSSGDSINHIYVAAVDAMLVNARSFSIATWVKFEHLTIDQQALWYKGQGYFSGDAISCYLSYSGGNNYLYFGRSGSQTNAQVSIISGVWYLVTCTYDEVTKVQCIYLNDVLIATNTITGSLTSADSYPLRMGLLTPGGGSASIWGLNQGWLSDFMCWDYALHQSEVSNLFRHDMTCSIQRNIINNPRPIIIWNTLDSTLDIQKPKIGKGWTNNVTGSNFTGDGVFGKSFYHPATKGASGEVCKYDSDFFVPSSGYYSCWLKPDGWNIVSGAASDGQEHIIFSSQTANPYFCMSMQLNTQIAFDTYSKSAYASGTWHRLGTNGVNLSSGTWGHFAFVWDAITNYKAIIFNGQVVASTSAWTSSYQFIQGVAKEKPCLLGGPNWINYGFKGWIDNFHVGRVFKTDFSDRFQERPGSTYKPTIQVSDKSLILWNTMNSANDVQNSKVGIGGTITGALSYGSAKFGNAPLFDSTGKQIVFDSQSLIRQIVNRGTILFYVKPTTNTGIHVIMDGTDPTFLQSYVSVLFNGSTWQFHNGKASGSPFYYLQHTYSFAANDVIPIAVMWDSAGIDGTSDKMRIYLPNGYTPGTNFEPLTMTALLFGQRADNLYSASSYIDNVRVYNYAKTDLLDQNYEAPINIKEIDV